MRTPLHISRQVLAQIVEEYLLERKRLRREGLREAIIHRHQEKGMPQPVGEEMEAHIDVLELLIETGNAEPDTIVQLIGGLELPPGSQPKSSQILIRLKKRLAEAKPVVRDDATLDQYHFEVTGRISTRCKSCRRGRRWTEQEFRQDRFLQRMLIGHQVTCPWCHTGQVMLSGVTAVRDAESQDVVPSQLDADSSSSGGKP